MIDKLYAIKEEREKHKQLYLGLCHNDPFPNNFLDDGTVRLIDWEKEDFLRHYFGQCDMDKLKGLEQMSFVVTFWNAMWAVLQTQVNELNDDYKKMAEHMFTHINLP